MVKVKPLQLFPVHKLPKGTEGWKQKMCRSCLEKPVWLLPWMANAEKVGCSFGGKVHSTDALAVQGCQGPSRWKTLEKGLHFRTCIITADCGVWAGAHRSIQLQHVQFPALIGWVSVYWPADCQQVSSKGETYKGIQAQRTVTAAGRKAGYVWQPTDCIICCPLFVACYPLFLEPPSHKMDMFGLLVAPFAVHCLLHLVLLKTGISFHIESNFASCGSFWLNLGHKTADKKLFIGEGFLIRFIRLPQWAGNGCNLSREG